MYEAVLLPLDGSDLAARAVPHAVTLAGRLGASLTLLTVIPSMDQIDTSQSTPDPGRGEMSIDVMRRHLYDQERARAEAYLKSVAQPLAGEDVRVQTSVRESGSPATAILEAATAQPNSLIILTPYGRTASLTAPKAGVFGGVADEVLRRATVPVLVVRS